MAVDDLLRAVATTVQDLALAWLIGAVVLDRWLSKGSDRSIRAAALLLLGTQPVLLWIEASVMTDLSLVDALPAVAEVARGTHYGAVWLGGTAVLVLLCADLSSKSIERRSRRRATWRGLLLAAFAYSRTLISHAAGDGDFNPAVLLDWTHLLLVSTWVGEVAIAAFAIGPGRDPSAPGYGSASFASTLSRSATWLLAGVLVTGFVKSCLGIGSPQNLVGNEYVVVLAVKLVFVAAAMGCGAFNRFFVLPAMRTWSTGEAPFFRVLKIESVLLACAMLAAAVLGATPPPTMSSG